MISATSPKKITEVIVRRQLKLALFYFKKYIEINYGKPCGNKVVGCAICDAWFFYKLLKEWVENK